MNKLNIIKLVHGLRTADCAGVTVIINQVCNIFTTYKSFKTGGLASLYQLYLVWTIYADLNTSKSACHIGQCYK